jgi:hypothetical protein
MNAAWYILQQSAKGRESWRCLKHRYIELILNRNHELFCLYIAQILHPTTPWKLSFTAKPTCMPQSSNSTEQSPWEADSQLARQKFTPFYGTRRIITIFTKVRHWSLSWASWIRSISSYRIYLRSILILSSYLRLGFLSYLGFASLPLKFYQNFVSISRLSHACYMPYILLDLIATLLRQLMTLISKQNFEAHVKQNV